MSLISNTFENCCEIFKEMTIGDTISIDDMVEKYVTRFGDEGNVKYLRGRITNLRKSICITGLMKYVNQNVKFKVTPQLKLLLTNLSKVRLTAFLLRSFNLSGDNRENVLDDDEIIEFLEEAGINPKNDLQETHLASVKKLRGHKGSKSIKQVTKQAAKQSVTITKSISQKIMQEVEKCDDAVVKLLPLSLQAKILTARIETLT